MKYGKGPIRKGYARVLAAMYVAAPKRFRFPDAE